MISRQPIDRSRSQEFDILTRPQERRSEASPAPAFAAVFARRRAVAAPPAQPLCLRRNLSLCLKAQRARELSVALPL